MRRKQASLETVLFATAVSTRTSLVVPDLGGHENGTKEHALPVTRVQRQIGVRNRPVDVDERDNRTLSRQL